MPRKNLKISKENFPSRLYSSDARHIVKKVEIDGREDTRFKDRSSAIRHYVNLGIVTEKRTETANTLDDKIIKSSQKEVVTETLLPVKTSIDELIVVMTNFGKTQEEFFTESNRKIDTAIRRLDGLNEIVNQQLSTILTTLLSNGKISEESLKNIIILRSIQYVFLLGHKTGRITEEDTQNISWEKFVKFTHDVAEELSFEELRSLATGSLNSAVIEQLARRMFKALKNGNLSVS